MGRRPIYMKSSHNGLKFLLLVALIVCGGYYLAKPSSFSWLSFSGDELVKNPLLKEKAFDADVKEIVSPRYGIKAYLLEDDTNPIISLSFLFKNAGYASDNKGEEGIALMTAALLGEGAGDYSSQEFKEILENKAIGIGFAADRDDFSGTLLTTKQNRQKAYELLHLALSSPRFEQEDVERVRQQMLESLKFQAEQPDNVLQLAFLQELYGDHPYARNPLGRAESIKNITQEKLKTFVKDNLRQNNLIVGIAGDISVVEAKLMLDDVFGSLPKSGKTNFIRDVEPKFDGRVKKIPLQSGQNIVMKAALGVNRKHEDFYPLFIANYIIGGAGLNSKLSQEIREKNGLTYGVYSYLGLSEKSPLLLAYYSATADKYPQAEALFEKVWTDFGKDGISEKELQKAKKYLISSYNLRFASIQNIADILAAMQKYDLGLDFLKRRNSYIEEIKLEDVNKAAKKYYNNHVVSVAVGRF